MLYYLIRYGYNSFVKTNTYSYCDKLFILLLKINLRLTILIYFSMRYTYAACYLYVLLTKINEIIQR